MPMSRPSAVATRYGIKCDSKNLRTVLWSIGASVSASLHGPCQSSFVASEATSAWHPTRKAGHASSRRSSFQPGSAVHATGTYFAGNDGAAGGAVGGGLVVGG